MARRYGTADEAFDHAVDFLEHFDDLEDPRQHAKVLYPLDEVLLLCLLGVLAGCESWVEISKYGEKKLDFLRRFRPFSQGTPSHDQLGDIFAVLDGEQFQHCFIAWTASLTGLSADVCRATIWMRHPNSPLTLADNVRSEIGAKRRCRRVAPGASYFFCSWILCRGSCRLTLKRNNYRTLTSSVFVPFAPCICGSLNTGYSKNKSGRRMPPGIEFKMDFLKYSLYRNLQSQNVRLRGFKNPCYIRSHIKCSDTSDSVGVPGLCPGHIRLKPQGPFIAGFFNTPITVKPDLSPNGRVGGSGSLSGSC